MILLEYSITEHCASDVLLDLLTPSWKALTGGCVLNRDTTGLLRSLGWHLVRHERYAGGLVRLIEALPPDTTAAVLREEHETVGTAPQEQQ